MWVIYWKGKERSKLTGDETVPDDITMSVIYRPASDVTVSGKMQSPTDKEAGDRQILGIRRSRATQHRTEGEETCNGVGRGRGEGGGADLQVIILNPQFVPDQSPQDR